MHLLYRRQQHAVYLTFKCVSARCSERPLSQSKFLKGDLPERRRVSGAARRTKPGQVRPAVGHAMPMGISDSAGSGLSVEHYLAVVRTASTAGFLGGGTTCLMVVLALYCCIRD